MNRDPAILWTVRLCAIAVFGMSYISAWRHEWGDMFWQLIISLIWIGIEIRDSKK